MGSFVCTAFILAFGYAYPAFECFKAIENKEGDTQKLLFWCQYWILVAIFTVCERIGDTFISWLPMYNGAKLGAFIYLWYPKTEGTSYVYNSFLRPYLSQHQGEIDRNLSELKVKVRRISVLYWQKGVAYGRSGFYKILQCLSENKLECFSEENVSEEHFVDSSRMSEDQQGKGECDEVLNMMISPGHDQALNRKQDEGQIESKMGSKNGISGTCKGMWKRIFKACSCSSH